MVFCSHTCKNSNTSYESWHAGNFLRCHFHTRFNPQGQSASKLRSCRVRMSRTHSLVPRHDNADRSLTISVMNSLAFIFLDQSGLYYMRQNIENNSSQHLCSTLSIKHLIWSLHAFISCIGRRFSLLCFRVGEKEG